MGGTYEGYPRGWFVVLFTEELAVGEVKALRYFGQKLVAFRGADGAVGVLDAYCPHLGADLGVGGTVIENSVRCPFHAWRFGSDGACVDVPYADRIPPKGERIKAWPTCERNGLIFVFYDRNGGPPDYEIPTIEGHGVAPWGPWNSAKLHIKTQGREVVENVADRAHFSPVHNTEIHEFDNEFPDHMAIQRARGTAYPIGGGKDDFAIEATYYGPGYQISEMDGVLRSRLLLAHTPIDEGHIDLRFGVSLKGVGDGAQSQTFSQMYVDNLRNGFKEDIAIWEHKVWRDRPLLCDGDGPIGKLRKWYRQFYV